MWSQTVETEKTKTTTMNQGKASEMLAYRVREHNNKKTPPEKLLWRAATYREYHQVEPVVFTLSYVRTSNLLVPSLHSVLTFNNIMHILPLPPCGLYSIRAQNGYGQHRPKGKIVLLTRVAPRGVTDLYLSWGIKIEKWNTRERPTMKLVELSINNHIVDVIHNHITNAT